jgi:hypothetical protein
MAKTKATFDLPPGRLWPNTPKGLPFSIPVIGGTGDWAAGKTLFGLSIAPGVHPEGHEFAGKPRTLYFDFEESGASYGGTGCERIDVPRKMLELRGDNYTPQDVAVWFVDYLLNKIRPRQYDVVMGDPITTVEAGVADYVRKHHDLFGLTANQIAKSEGLFWGAVKDYYERILLKLNAKCQTFYYTTHLRQQYEGNVPVRGKKEPKGKDTLFQLSSLYLWFERLPDKATGKAPSVPSARVLKERCSETWVDEDGSLQITQFLPPRLPQATVHAIRCYIANPPVYAKLKDEEKVTEDKMSEEDKLQLQLAVAEAEERVTGNRIAMLARQEELRRLDQTARSSTAQSPDQSGQLLKQQRNQQAAVTAASEVQQAVIDRLKAEADAKIVAAQQEGAKLAAAGDTANANRPTEAEVQATKILFGQLKIAAAEFKVRCGGKVFAGLTRAEAQTVMNWLAKLKTVKEVAESVRHAKALSEEAWVRLLKDKILAPVGVDAVEKLDDANLDRLVDLLKSEQAKCVQAQKEAAAKN